MKNDRITTSAFGQSLLTKNGNVFRKQSEVLNYLHILMVMTLALTRRSITPRLRRMRRDGMKKTMMQMTNPSSQLTATLKGKCFARPASYSRSQSRSGGATIQARCLPAPLSPPMSRGSSSRSTSTLLPSNRYPLHRCYGC